jgi:hypothetical protein
VRSSTNAALAGAGVVVSVAAGVVTNLITAKWSWGLVVLLVGLAVCGATLAALSTASSQGRSRQRTLVRQRARGGRVINSVVEADAGARVEEHASRAGQIRDVHTLASGADVRRNAKDGTIEGGGITAS